LLTSWMTAVTGSGRFSLGTASASAHGSGHAASKSE
jgi:hypothetical protein